MSNSYKLPGAVLSAGLLVISPVAFADLFDELDAETAPGGANVQTSEEEQEEFRRFVEERNAEYAAFREQLLAEFEEYKQIVQEETNRYQGKLSENWEDPKLSTNKVWVEYSEDTLTRKSVDFEEQSITIELPAEDDPDEAREELREQLTELVTKNKAEAFEDDVVAQAVEERSKEEVDFLVTAEVQPEPILLTYLTGLVDATKQQVSEIVDYMLENIELETVEQEGGRKVQKVKVPLEAPVEVVAEAEKQVRESATGAASQAANIEGLSQKARALYPTVEKFAARDEVERSLVYAIIETESAFNPVATSHIPAYGLMQIVPESAGIDATKKLFGQERILSSSYLYNSEKNIEIGTTYLNILYYRYLRKIENPQSRLYCAMAAYNTGAGNVAKAFTGTFRINDAVKIINKQSPEEVYENLRADLTYEEARNYVKKVRARKEKYEALGL